MQATLVPYTRVKELYTKYINWLLVPLMETQDMLDTLNDGRFSYNSATKEVGYSVWYSHFARHEHCHLTLIFFEKSSCAPFLYKKLENIFETDVFCKMFFLLVFCVNITREHMIRPVIHLTSTVLEFFFVYVTELSKLDIRGDKSICWF